MSYRQFPIIFLAFCMVTLVPGTAAAAPKYVGTDGCASCHKTQTMAWGMSVHRKAYETLKPGKKRAIKKKLDLDPKKDYTKEEKCLKCHVTGYKEEGGFISAKETPKMAGVGCESCHGPGSEYRVVHDENPTKIPRDKAKAAGAVYGSEDEKVCTACHGHPDSPTNEKVDKKYKFDWKKKLAKQDSYHFKGGFGFGF